MKIYDLSKIPGIGHVPPEEPDYQEIYDQAYSSGYTKGYTTTPCYPDSYFTVELLEDADVSFYGVENHEDLGTYYRINGGEWFNIKTPIPPGPGPIPPGLVLSLKAGDLIEVRSTNGWPRKQLDFPCKVYGNVMSLLYGDDFKEHNDAPGYVSGGLTLMTMLEYSSGIVDASNLIMPSGNIGYAGCLAMFAGCTSLVYPPKLPSKHIGEAGYYMMFRDCTSLVNAPELPATDIKYNAYEYMFMECTSLINGPSVLPAMNLPGAAYPGMFRGCTSLTGAPFLPALTAHMNDYTEMFYGCSSLSSVTCLATDVSEAGWGYGTTVNWLKGVADNGVFIKNPDMHDWPTDSPSGIPSGWTVEDYQE